MKRNLSLLLLVFVLVFATVVPGVAEEAKPEKLTIIADLDGKAAEEAYAKSFTEKYGIEIELISPAYYDTHDKIVTTVLGGGECDIFQTDSVWLMDFVEAGITVSLNDYMTDEFKSSLMGCFTDALAVNGVYYTIPTAPNAMWLYYNKDMLAEAGYDAPPATWDELFEMSQKMVDMGLCKYGIAWPACQAEGTICMFTSILTGYGSNWRDAEGNWCFNGEEGVTALNVLVESINNGIADLASVTYDDRTDLDPLMAGDVAFVPNWAYAYALVNNPEESAVAGSIDVALLPAGNEGVVSSSCLGGAGMCVTSISKHPEWAIKYIIGKITPEFQDTLMETTGTMPILMSSYTCDYAKEHIPQLELMAPQFDYVVARPQLSDYNTWSEEMQLCIAKALDGSMTIQEALDEGVRISEEMYG